MGYVLCLISLNLKYKEKSMKYKTFCYELEYKLKSCKNTILDYFPHWAYKSAHAAKRLYESSLYKDKVAWVTLNKIPDVANPYSRKHHSYKDEE